MESLSLLLFTAFVCGFLATRVGLPPLIGYLAAGFSLHYFGLESTEDLQYLADTGILLLLFSIGLKLKVKSLARPEIWGSATIHMLITVCIFGLTLFLLGTLGLSYFTDFSLAQSALLGFALSFSSTVFAVKTFEERGDMGALHGNISIGVLIIQDIAAVLFLTFSTGKFPSIWALAFLPVLFGLRPLFLWLLNRSGHRELLVLFGIFIPISLGAGGFELVGLKPDLGALLLGVLLSDSPRASELSEVILSFKDLLLVGFFLNIGLSGLPSTDSLLLGILFTLLLFVKNLLFFGLFTRFRLRARTALLSSLALSNYSEFGLLVCSIGVQKGIIGTEWLITMAVALSLSFIVASPLNSRAYALYGKMRRYLTRFETRTRLAHDQPVDTGDANVLIFGMGRMGTTAYDTIIDNSNLKVVGLDFDPDNVKKHVSQGRNVICDDATDSDLWEKICTHKIRVVMLCMASHQANMHTIEQLQEAGYDGRLSATAQFADDQAELMATGVDFAYDIYNEAGQGFADNILEKLKTMGQLR